jgi:ABC-type hemin transport system substrate-binding protein
MMRVVSHSCSNTEIVCALGCAHLLVGVDDHSDYPEDVVAGLPRVGPDLGRRVDEVVALRPDLVLASRRFAAVDPGRVVAQARDRPGPTLVGDRPGRPRGGTEPARRS